MKERRVDVKAYDPERRVEANRTAHVLHQLNLAEQGTAEYDNLVRELFTGGYGRNNNLVTPIFVNIASHLHIGSHVSIQSYFTCMSAGDVFIDDYVRIAMKVSIVTNNHDFYDRDILTVGDVHICRNAWIGAGAIILPGITVGENAVVGAGSVVTHDVAPNTVVVGNPARVLRVLDPAKFIVTESQDTNAVTIDISDLINTMDSENVSIGDDTSSAGTGATGSAL